MAKAKGRPAQPNGAGAQVRIDPEIVRKAKFVASERRISMAEYLGGLLRDAVARDYTRHARELGGGGGE